MRLRLAFILCTMAMATTAGAVSLQQLLQDMPDGPAVQSAQAQTRHLQARASESRQQGGWSLYASMTAGDYRELDPVLEQVDYQGTSAEIGLQYPLLGTHKRQALNQAQARLRAAASEHLADEQRQNREQSLRLAYIEWWHTHQLQEYCVSYQPLARREIELVETRLEAGRLLPSEAQWFRQRWRELLRPCDNLDRQIQHHRQRLSHLSGTPLSPQDKPVTARLTSDTGPERRWEDVLEHHPGLKNQVAALRESRKLPDAEWYDAIDAGFRIGHQIDQRNDLDGTGQGLVVGLNFRLPLNSLRNSTAASPTHWQREKLKNQWLDQRQQLRERLYTELERYRSDTNTLKSRLAWWQWSRNALRESRNRQEEFGQVRERQLERVNRHRSAIDAWAQAWQTRARLLSLTGQNKFPASDTGDLGWPAAQHPAGWQQSVYLWDSTQILDPADRTKVLERLQTSGFNRIYLGLSAEQIAQWESTRPAVKTTLATVHQQGLSVELLLGEPLWIRPDHRPKLAAIIEKLSDLDFDGLHLDLEVEQLGWPVPDSTVKHWLDTVRLAQQTSRWPVSLVSHHRWFSDTEQNELCVPCQLQATGVERVSIMAYITDIERITDMGCDIHRRWPKLTINLVQSNEPQLEPANSWQAQSASSLQAINHRIKHHPGECLSGIAWQSWRHWPQPTHSEHTP